MQPHEKRNVKAGRRDVMLESCLEVDERDELQEILAGGSGSVRAPVRRVSRHALPNALLAPCNFQSLVVPLAYCASLICSDY